uniref:SAC3/GANP/THP3 conserved domain-containing protein n=1 Tax=Parascaris equorum TaxID=6256 RepID=A0A914S9U3_PAREQ
MDFSPRQGLLTCFSCRVVSEYDSREAWPDVYEFVSDRLRAIRQDMIVENLDAEKSILLLESMIPFYAEAEYR